MGKPLIMVKLNHICNEKQKRYWSRRGFKVYVERVPHTSEAVGCGYGVYVPQRTEEAQQILQRSGISNFREEWNGLICDDLFGQFSHNLSKTPQVSMAMSRAMTKFGANPGRSGHAMSIAAAEEIFKCREAAASFFHADGPECVVFTLNCTQAINMVLKGYVKPGDHIVTSCLEHNAVSRPLQTMADRMHVTFTEVTVTLGDNDATVNAFRQALKPNTSLIVCTHASNVWGIRLPVERIASLGREYGIPILVDAAQSAGVLPIDLQDSGNRFFMYSRS